MSLKSEILSVVNPETNESWLPTKFRYLKSISASRGNYDEKTDTCDWLYAVEIVLMEDIHQETSKLRFTASGARDLKVKEIEGFFGNEVYIMDISDRQLEGVKFQVTEHHENHFSFVCKDFEVEILDN